MAIINKASMVLLMIFVVATISDAARFDFDSSLQLNKYSESEDFFSECECAEESGVTKCRRFHMIPRRCPADCKDKCICTRSIPSMCFCKFEVESCANAASAISGFKDFIIRAQVKP